MSGNPPDFNQAWQGLEPEQPRPRRGIFLVALAAATFLLLGGCVLGYMVLQERTGGQTDADPSAPTATIGSIAEVTTTPELTPDTGATTPAIAPTSTLPGLVPNPPIQPGTEIIAPRLDGRPVIDGFADRVGLPAYTSPYVVFTHSDWDGTDDLVASWEIAWDDTYLYIMATVTDDVHVQTQVGATAFRGDSLELQVDVDRSGDYGPSLSPDDFQISLSPGDFNTIPLSAWRFQGTPAGEMLDAPGPHSILVAAQRNIDGYTLEAAIPWRDLNLAPAPGLVVGLAVNFNDNDGPGTAVQEMMKSSAPNRRFGDPTTWGTLRLE